VKGGLDGRALAGKAAVVTGGTRGIGAVIAARFLAEGASVLVCGRKTPARLPEGGGRVAEFIAADVREPDQAKALVETAAARFGRLDIVVNNAGGSPDSDAATVSPRFVQSIVNLNLLAPFYVAQPANAIMQAQPEGGVIINIGSVAGINPNPRAAAYAAAKAGLTMLTHALALEWGPLVRVNQVTVGLVATENAAQYYGGDEGQRAIAALIPAGRMATPDDVASACLLLASPLAGYISGADLRVDGGGEVPARFIAARFRGLSQPETGDSPTKAAAPSSTPSGPPRPTAPPTSIVRSSQRLSWQ
jgi:NAD(P)-dependent dehydrogenase (short-subunit alcohol dehydrogenase family)